MYETNHRRLRDFAVVLAIALISRIGCRNDRSERGETPISWDSPEMRKIEKDWTALHQKYGRVWDQGASVYFETRRLFRGRLSKQDVMHLAATCDVLPLHVVQERFQERFQGHHTQYR